MAMRVRFGSLQSDFTMFQLCCSYIYMYLAMFQELCSAVQLKYQNVTEDTKTCQTLKHNMKNSRRIIRKRCSLWKAFMESS